ncbi:glycosyltransferase family 4 protein [Bacteroides sp. UBA939]|uniref:glycosyltransferase family 4 protein n=1 Tax=Bacteroides sp. UBA939 TaxID=1946092 RepID=UPI0025C221DB|nr:glycosyltransferase family 4 protein [Bacteroides sp. UBA939]
MKIVVTGTRGIPDIPGGVETHCEELYPLIADERHEVVVVRRPCYAPDDLVKTYRKVRIKDIRIVRNKHLEAFLHTFQSVLYAWKIKADIVHIHAVGPALMTPLVRMLGMKAVVTHHGPDYDREKWGKFAKWILRMGEKVGMNYANHVIVVSDYIRQLVRQKYLSKKNITLIYNGINKKREISETDYIQSLGLTEYGYILAVGRFVKEKGFDRLIKAFGQLSSSSIKLVIAGDADYQDEYARKLKKMCKEQENICLTGFIKGDKLAQLYTNARIFVLPSTHEGLPIVLLEAMSYGCPILASDIPANKEIGLPDECYFKNGDIDSLKDALKKRLENSQREQVIYNMSSYDWRNIARQTKDIYDSLII